MHYKLIIIWIVLCLCVIGKGVDELNEHSSGQLVRVQALGSGTPCVMIYRKPGSEAGKWICQGLFDNQLRVVSAASFRVLPMTEQIQPWELTTYCIYQLSCKCTSVDEAVIKALLEWRGGERGVLVRRYLSEEKQFMNSIGSYIRPCFSKKKSTRDTAICEIREKLTNAKLVNTLDKFMAKGDYYAATLLLSRFKAVVIAPLPYVLVYDELLGIFGGWESIILNGYVPCTNKVMPRYQVFRTLFPKNGGAVFVEPVSYKDLLQKCHRSYTGYETTRSKSSICDFEEWGAGMLSVLQTLPGDSEAALKFGAEFDAALKQYQDYMKQAGN